MAFGDFLSSLGDMLDQQFSTGENKNRSLDIVQDGHTKRYGKLGEFANKFDQSAQRSYVEEGSFRVDILNPKPKQYEVLFQEPDTTVLIKKRAFSSLSENFRPDLMDDQERLFYKATKILFQNKCKQISNFEKLSKIEKISTQIGSVDYHLLPLLFQLTDDINSGGGGLIPSAVSSLSKFKSVIDRVRTVVNLSKDNIYTTWITNVPDSFRSDFGEGTGVIELTTVTSLTTTTSVNFGQGQFSLNISDPYELMLITNSDIEQAINDATNSSYSNQFISLSKDLLDSTIALNKRQLALLRNSRRVSPIRFIVNPDTFLGKRVRALIDNIGFEIQFDGSIFTIKVDQSALISGDLGKEGLSPDEVNLFGSIINGIFSGLSLNANSRNQTNAKNEETNYIRKKIRLHYANKLIIQPMDTVHIYIGSKTKADNKILGGLQNSFTSLGFLQGANNALLNIRDFLGNDEGFSLEKSLFVGNDFPNWMWQILRNQFVGGKNGTHVFAGVVEEASSNFNGGFFSVSANGTDNTAYFNYGIINFKPSVDVFNGELYNALTPFKIEFDTVTGFQKTDTPDLLSENKSLFDSAFIRNKNGIFAGRKPTVDNFNHDADRTKNNSVRRVFYDPDGMVYRWKEGIGSLVLFGDSYTDNPINNQSVPATTTEPFAGQDVMNVLSLLITGEPYNYVTFYKAATQFDSFGRDPQTGKDSSVSYFKNLQNELKTRNLVYGNFIPFKKLTVSEDDFKNVINNQINANNFDADLRSLLERRATLTDKILLITGKTDGAKSLDASVTGIIGAFSAELDNLDIQINDKQQRMAEELSKSTRPLKIIGDDISFDYSPELGTTDKNKNDPEFRKELRRKVNFLTRRLIWKVRANEDVNLFIVDDSYDKDYDIQAFEKSFTNPALFASEYTTVSDRIKSVALFLGLEVFANSQGHIEIRPPQYNRTPSSVFHKMIRLRKDLGIQLYPKFLEDLYLNQLSSLSNQIEVLEDEIRLLGLAVGQASDSDVEQFLNNKQNALPIGSPGKFKFLTAGGNSSLTATIQWVIIESNPDQKSAAIDTVLHGAEEQNKVSNVFDISTRATAIGFNSLNIGNGVSLSTFSGSENAKAATIKEVSKSNTRLDEITKRLNQKTGRQYDLQQLFPNTDANGKFKQEGLISNLDIFKITNDIASKLSERQKLIKLFVNALRNTKEGFSLGQTKEGSLAPNALSALNLMDNKNIPEALEHMIENEGYDDYGPGSGQRYILKNSDVISYKISEKRPQFTAIDVTGRLGDNFIANSDLPQDLSVGQNGNAQVTAHTVDYDLWRQYGISLPQAIDAPYLTDPNTQCAPYAVSLLNKNRKQIFSGSIDIIGNEYQQPGEVIYLENRDLLFYVESVSHSFTFGQKFTTSMNIGYGHNPGEYIPTMLDVVGKVLYKNKDIVHYVHAKEGNVFNQEYLGTIMGDVSSGGSIISTSTSNDILSGSNGDSNRKNLDQIIESALTALGTSTSDFQPTIEIRIFINSSTEFATASSSAQDLASSVKDFLVGKTDLQGDEDKKIVQKSLKAFNAPDIIKIVTINGADGSSRQDGKGGEFGYPSSIAYKMAREGAKSRGAADSSGNTALANQIDQVIYNFIVDVWVVFKNPASSK